MNDTPVMKATGKELDAWFAILDEHEAHDLPHKDIARLLTGEYDVPAGGART